MSLKTILSFQHSPTLAVARWLGRVLKDDSSRFMERYPVLAMTPDEAYRTAIGRVLEKMPEHVPISAKLAFAVTLLISAGMIGLGILIGANQSRLLDQQTALLGSMVAKQVADSVKEPLLAGDISSLEIATRHTLDHERILGVAVFADDRKRVASSGLIPPDPLAPVQSGRTAERDESTIPWQSNSSSSPKLYISFIQPIRHQDVTVGYVLLTFDRSLLTMAKNQTIHMVATTTIVMIIFGIVASLLLGNRMTRPINELIRVSRAIVNGDYNFRVREQRKDEIGILMDSMNAMGKGLLRKEQVEKVFGKYVSDNVAKQVLKDLEQVEQSRLGGHHVQASVLFADIVGFTELSESMPAKEISELLNLYFTYIAKVVRFCGGHIDKYIGDCAMIVFGVPEANPNHAYHAASCAWMINRLVNKINKKREQDGKIAVQLRIGMNSGTMVAGNMGSSERMEYTVVGDAVNLASRLSHAGKPGEIIVTEDVLLTEKLDQRICTEPVDTIRIRGKKEPVSIHRIANVDTESREKIYIEINRILHYTAPEVV